MEKEEILNLSFVRGDFSELPSYLGALLVFWRIANKEKMFLVDNNKKHTQRCKNIDIFTVNIYRELLVICGGRPVVEEVYENYKSDIEPYLKNWSLEELYFSPKKGDRKDFFIRTKSHSKVYMGLCKNTDFTFIYKGTK